MLIVFFVVLNIWEYSECIFIFYMLVILVDIVLFVFLLFVLVFVNLDDFYFRILCFCEGIIIKFVFYFFLDYYVNYVDVVFNQLFIGSYLYYFCLKLVFLLNVFVYICILQDGFLEVFIIQLMSMFMEQIKKMLCICYFFYMLIDERSVIFKVERFFSFI